eukprot:m.138992 g.138992  ORF g.138992 m.138992 type:complete len:387 (+) comp17045_c0_seq1:112-1272(+)
MAEPTTPTSSSSPLALVKKIAIPVYMAYWCGMFVCSGLVIVALQAVSCVLLWYPARSLYRRVNAFLVNFYWTELIFFGEWWGNVRLRIFAEPGTIESVGTDRAVAVLNHRSDIDWLLGWFIASNFNVLGGTKCLLKSTLRYLPVLGWSWWFLEYTFLSRSWERDQGRLRKSLGILGDFPGAFWVVIFAEGTRLTDEKLAASQEHCRSKGLPVLKNVMYPRTKGFSLAVDSLHDHIDCLYDVTLAFPGDIPTFGGVMAGKPYEVSAYIRRTPTDQVPKDNEGSAQWCVDCFQKMDERLEHFKEHQVFDSEEYPYKRQLFPLIVSVAWLLIFTALLAWAVVPPLLAGSYWPAILLFAYLFSGHMIMQAGQLFAKRSSHGSKATKPKSK